MGISENPDQSLTLSPKGFTNIGSSPDNDIILGGEQILPYHMMLDYHEVPYRLLPLSQDAEIWVNGVRLRGSQEYLLSASDGINVGNYRLSLAGADDGTPPHLSVTDLQLQTGVSVSGYQKPAEKVSNVDASEAAAPTNEVILAALLEDTPTPINVEQTAYYSLKVTNGSPIVSTFNVRVEGVPEDWVIVAPLNVNLFEGGQAEVKISITPPRKPSSHTGAYPLRFVVTSLNHPGKQTVVAANLEINPYYEFSIDEVTPRRKSIAWRQRFGEVKMKLINRGNSSADFNLNAQDEENECRFQLFDPESVKNVASLQFPLPAGETQEVPIHITPNKRSLVSLHSRQYPYRVAVSQQQNDALVLSSIGTAIGRPLIGWLGLLITLVCTVAAIFILFTPRIDYFQADRTIIGENESTTLRWKTAFFTRNLKLTGVDDPNPIDTQGTLDVYPSATVNSYVFNATTWLWNMLGLDPLVRSFSILAVPNEPVIKTFNVSQSDNVLVGDTLTLRWSVDNATEVSLTINGVTEVFDDKKDFNGERSITIEKDTLISLVGTNALGSTVKSIFIQAGTPTIVIDKFEVDNTTVYTGDQVTVSWKVSGVGMDKGGEVTISPFDGVLPNEGQLTFFPSESTEFVLSVKNRGASEIRILPVGVLEPASPPDPPKINFFTAAPDTLTGSGNVELSWSVSGIVDDIKITNEDNVIADGLAAQGFRTISVAKSGTYVITAIQNATSTNVGSNLKITVNPALIKPTLTITNIYPADKLEMGDTVTVAVNVAKPETDDPPPTGNVIVSDGFSTCVIELPKTTCGLLFETPGTKTITATYQGDSNYVQAESLPYKPALVVLGNTISLQNTLLPLSSVYRFNQKVNLTVTVSGTNVARMPDGELRVRRLCDPTAIYNAPCSDTVIGYHKLTSADSGAYKFSDLTIDQVGGNWKLQITLSGDSFYSDTASELNLPVDNTTSPVSIDAVTGDPIPGLVNRQLSYTITVQDENASSIYNVPQGKVTLTATHTDGDTVACSDLTLADNGDGRSARATCNLVLPKSGDWSLSAKFSVASTDIIHKDTSQIFSDLPVDSNVAMDLSYPPSSITYSFNQTFNLDLTRQDTGDAISAGSLACSFPSGSSDGTCSCSYQSGSSWKCTAKATPPDSLPSDKQLTFFYTPASGAFLNATQLPYTVTVVKAKPTVSLSAAPSDSYPIGGTYSFTINPALSGGTLPTSGTVTAILGTGPCTTSDGMTTGVLNTYSANLGTAQTITFTHDQVTGSNNLVLCYRYDGDGKSYAASNYSASKAFQVTAAGTTASIAVQPDTDGYQVGEKYSITVTATRSGSTGANPTSGTVTIQLGSGNCIATTGMDGGILNTYTPTVGNAQSVTFATTHVVGKDLRFCVRYDGDGDNFNPSGYISSTAFRVKAVPTWGSLAQVDFAASQNKDVTKQFSVTLNNGYSLAGSPNKVTLALASDTSTVVCPATTSEISCQQSGSPTTNGTATTFTFTVAANTAKKWSIVPLYAGDANNVANTGTTAFTLRSYYNIQMGSSVSATVGCPSCTDDNQYLYAYTPIETSTADVMQTDLATTFNISNFTVFDYTSLGLSALTVAKKANGDTVTVDPASSTCTITNGSSAGKISCPGAKVTDFDRFHIRDHPDAFRPG